jgi:hypothetical protein
VLIGTLLLRMYNAGEQGKVPGSRAVLVGPRAPNIIGNSEER